MTGQSRKSYGRGRYHGDLATAYARAVYARYGTICHLCGRPTTPLDRSVDHLKPRSTHPWLMFVVDNGRPAHQSCNSVRALAPVPDYESAGW